MFTALLLLFFWSRDSDRGEITGLANEVTELQGQLQQLYGQVLKLIEEGDEDTARELIEANYQVVVEQVESGYTSIEQIAMLDILAQLRLSLGEFEEAEYLLDQVCPLDILYGPLVFKELDARILDSN